MSYGRCRSKTKRLGGTGQEALKAETDRGKEEEREEEARVGEGRERGSKRWSKGTGSKE